MNTLLYILAATLGAALLAVLLDFFAMRARGNALLRLIQERSTDVVHIWVDQPGPLARLYVQFRRDRLRSALMVHEGDALCAHLEVLNVPLRDMRVRAVG